MTLTISGSHSIGPERPAHWYAQPATGDQHAFRGIRSACHRFTWQASWSIVGEVEHIDRSKACDECVVATGATEAELRQGGGNR